jgi:hypothetical protein
MTPKEKAKELYKLQFDVVGSADLAIKTALIAAKEALSAAWWSATGEMAGPYRVSQKEFWEEVIKELNRLL